jgi:uncharacterized membrane protein
LTEGETPARRPPTGDHEPPAVDPEVVDEADHRPGRTRAYDVAGEVIHQSVSFRSAPYPTPQDLREYEEIHSGFTGRILTLVERETEHRIQRDRVRDQATIDIARRGQTRAFIVVMTLVIGGIVAILTDHSIVGFAGLVLAAATLAGAFVAPAVLSRRSGSREHEPDAELPERSDTGVSAGQDPAP